MQATGLFPPSAKLPRLAVPPKQRRKRSTAGGLAAAALLIAATATAFQPPKQAPLPNFDQREKNVVRPRQSAEQIQAVNTLRARVPAVQVEFHPVIGSPKSIAVADGFLSGANGEGKAISQATAAGVPKDDPYRATKAFLTEHRQLFGHGPEALAAARIQREFTGAHNGLKTVVWEQQVGGVPVFEAVLISHTTRNGELVNISSQFVPAPDAAANRGVQRRGAVLAAPAISAAQAVKLAAENLAGKAQVEDVTATSAAEATPEKRQKFRAAFLRGESDAKLTWAPMDKNTLRLCWDVILTSREHPEMYRVLVDAQSGAIVIRRCLTAYISDVSYRVFTSDSPSPFSPGHLIPLTNQPPVIARTLVTWPALDTNASPAGWINDGGNETLGNNVDAHTDRNDNDIADLPRPQGSPFRVFDFPMNLATDDPTSYGNAAVVQLFYLCNWYHDKLYQLGFTEAAGNFQSNNFGRGGLGNDAVQADAQDGGGTDNANFSTPPDGSPGRMQMYIFSGPSPRRDGDLDAEIVLHEHTHGLSNRRVGGGIGLSALQSDGMGEGWSDWYGLTLLSESGDDVNANYAAGGYATYKFLSPTFQQNYYYGIRRYPYSTDMTKNPLTFKDIDPAQASSHPGVPISPVIGGGGASEVHNQGEVWCVTLWDARANLIAKHGFAIGNQLILQLVTDGMNLSPANPNFLQARDAIIQADLVLTGGANQNELWAAFAKRGMGANATSPSSSTTTGVFESFDLPDALSIRPAAGFIANGPVGGPFTPNSTTFTLTNNGAAALNWTMINTTAWLNVSLAGGLLTPGGPSASISASLNNSASILPMGVYSGTVRFTNLTSGVGAGRAFSLRVGQPDFFAENFDAGDNDLAFSTITFMPNGSASFYAPCREVATNFPTDPTGGNFVSLSDDSYIQVTLSGTNTVGIYNRRTNFFFISSNGYLTFDFGDSQYEETFEQHFSLPRVSALFDDLYPPAGGTISWRELSNRVAVTYQDIPEYGTTDQNSFQIEMFFDGRIRLTWLALAARDGLAGLSSGGGVPVNFLESDLSAYGSCVAPLIVTLPASATEGAGLLVGAGHVILSAPLLTNLTVTLASSDTTEITVPASAIIVAGQTNQAFDVTVVDDAILDGTRNTIVTATASGFGNGVALIAVHDNETAVLHVNLPATVSESGGSTQGVVTVSAAVAENVTVSLNSSDTLEIQVPSSVVIPAGQTSAVFVATIVDDFLIDGAQNAIVTAHVQNWTDGTAMMSVLDNETLQLAVTVPYFDYEDTGTLINGGTVHLSGTLPTNLVVSLTSFDLTELTVPPTITIPAGQFSATFNITLIDDFIVDGEQMVTISASAPGFVSGFGQMSVLDVESPSAPANVYPPDLSSNVPASGTILQWFTAHPGATNDVFLGTNSSPGVTEFLGSTKSNSWPLPLLAPNTTYYWRIGVRNIGSNSSPVWRFTTRGLDHFDISTVPSPLLINQPFAVAVTARDELNRAITNFPGPVNLAGGARSNSILQSPLHSFVSQTLNGYSYSLGYAFTPNVNITVTAVRHYFGSKISIWTDNGVLLAAQPVVSVPGTWRETSLTSPVVLTAGTRYRVVCYTAVDQFYWREDGPRTFPHGTIDQNYDTTGDAFPTTAGDLRWWFADLRYTLNSSTPAAFTPANTGAFTNGVWSGNVTVLGAATNMTLEAVAASGHFGISNPFHVVGSNQPPIVLTQPVSQTVITGATVNLAVSVLGTPPLTYQWRFNGSDLAGKTNATLTLVNVLTNQSGFYSVKVTNLIDVAVSSNALLTVIQQPPFFDDFEPGIHLANWSLFSGTVLATNYGGSVSGVNSLWLGGNGSRFAVSRFVDTSLGGVVDFYLRIANGAAEPWENADLPEEGIVLEYSVNGGGSWIEFGRYNTESYKAWSRVVEDIPAGAQTGATQFRWRQLENSGSCCDHWALDDVTVSTGPRPPIVIKDLGDRFAFVGGTVTFNAAVSGSSPLHYQWRKNDIDIANATNASYTIANLQTNDTAKYRVSVTNLYGSALSSNAALTVLPLINGPVTRVAVYGSPDDDSYNADVRSKLEGTGLFTQVDQFIIRPGYPVPTLGDLAQYQAVLVYSDDNLNDPVGLGDVLADYVDGGGGVVLATFSFENANIDLRGRLVTGGYMPFVDGPQDQGLPLTLVPDQPAHPILAGVNSFNGGSSSYHNIVTMAPGATLVAHWSNGRPLVATLQRTNGTVVGLNFYPPSSDLRGDLWQAGTDGALLMANALRVAGRGSAPLAVAFTVQPTNQFVLPGTNVTLTALAASVGPVTYQWRFEGTNILNATNASYSFTNANLTNHHGNFYCVAHDGVTTAISSNAFIYVLVRPGIVTHIQPITVLQGGTATFSLVATGAPPLWYRWVRSGLSYATTSVPVLVITNIQASALIRVAVTNMAAPGGVFSPGPTAGQNVSLTMLPDFDGDGISDLWEAQYGFNINNAADALLDFDGDGMSNRDEYLAGTNPTDASSVLKIVLTATNANVLTFVAQTNLTYSVHWRSNFVAAPWLNLTSVPADPLVRTIVVDTATVPPSRERYFRIVTPMVP